MATALIPAFWDPRARHLKPRGRVVTYFIFVTAELLDDPIHFGNVEATSRHVSAHQDALVRTAELVVPCHGTVAKWHSGHLKQNDWLSRIRIRLIANSEKKHRTRNSGKRHDPSQKPWCVELLACCFLCP